MTYCLHMAFAAGLVFLWKAAGEEKTIVYFAGPYFCSAAA